jgi:hypothetical protein
MLRNISATLVIFLLGSAPVVFACEMHEQLAAANPKVETETTGTNTILETLKPAPTNSSTAVLGTKLESINEELEQASQLEAKAEIKTESESQKPMNSAVVAPSKPAETAAIPKEAVSELAKSDLEVVEFVLAQQIDAREPKNIVENFNKENQRGYAFARLSSPEIKDVTFIWFREGKEYSRYKTTVQAAKKWRTFSSVKLRPGHWKVQLVSNDAVLAEKAFTLE